MWQTQNCSLWDHKSDCVQTSELYWINLTLLHISGGYNVHVHVFRLELLLSYNVAHVKLKTTWVAREQCTSSWVSAVLTSTQAQSWFNVNASTVKYYCIGRDHQVTLLKSLLRNTNQMLYSRCFVHILKCVWVLWWYLHRAPQFIPPVKSIYPH